MHDLTDSTPVLTVEMPSVASSASPDIPISSPNPVRWNFATRLSFRVCFIYFGLYILMTQMNFIPGVPSFLSWKWVQAPVFWTIKNVFHDTRQNLLVFGGSGDKIFDYVFVLCLSVFSVVLGLVWSAIDRRRPNYVRLNKWFRVFARFGMATTMLTYGMIKAIPLQMSAPSLTRLLEPYGNFSPMGVLWASIGASFPYERLVGSMELLAAVLLFIPQTVVLGGVVALIDSIQIFSLNMTYDVPVKLFSLHLILLSIYILAPDIQRLLNVMVFNRTALPSTVPPLGRRTWAIRLGIAAQLLLGGYFIWAEYQSNNQSYYTFGSGAPRPALYGIWVIDKMTIDGVERAPLVTDYDRWRRVVIQSTTSMNFWRMDDTTFGYAAKYDMEKKTITLTQGTGTPQPAQNVPNAKTIGTFAFERPAPDTLILTGDLNGKKLRMETHLFPREDFLLVKRGFNLIQEFPFNR